MLAADITQTTAQDISAFLSAGLAAGLAPSTLNAKLSILASFFAYLCDAGVMQQQPVSRRQHRVLMPEVLPKAIPDADLVAFFQVIDSLRDRLLFLLMLRCGLRVSEACALTWEAIDLQAGAPCASIKVKGGWTASSISRPTSSRPCSAGRSTTAQAHTYFPVPNAAVPTSFAP